MLTRAVLGLDLGTYSVKIAELAIGLRSVEFARCQELRLPHAADAEERETAIRLFLEERELPREFVVSALAADRVTQRHLRFPFGGRRRIEQAIGFEIEEGVPLPLEQVVLADEQVPAGPDQTDVLAVLAPRSSVAQHLEYLRRLDTEPNIIEVEGLVLANLSHYLELQDASRLLLDVGHRKTTLCLTVGGKPLALRTIPVAGHHFTEALARDGQLSYEAAEQSKHENGLFEPLSSKPACAGVEQLLERLVRETLRSVHAVASNPLDPIAPDEIVLMGGSGQAPGLGDYLAQQTGLPVKPLTVPSSREGADALAAAGPAVFAHAAALALRGLRRERVTRVDLRQDEFRYVADLSDLVNQGRVALALFGALLVLWVASLGTQLWSAEARALDLRSELARVYQQTFPGETVPSDPARALTERLREGRELANHLGVTGGGISVLEVLRQISAHIPQDLDISLSDLRLERHSVRARGYTRDFITVDKVRAQLQQVESFQNVVLSDVVNEPRRGGKSFALTIEFAGSQE